MSQAIENGGAQRRRFVLFLLSAFPSAVLAGKSGGATPGQLRLEATLSAYLDTLLPRDDLSPSSSDLGLHRQVLAESGTSRFESRLIRAGCAWLDLAAEGPFMDASPAVREVIVTWMAASDWNQVPRRFHEVMRQRVLELYFSRIDTLGGLPIHQPPQPGGYPEPWS